MYKCHLCNLQTKQLNGLLSKHYKIHCNESYSKEQYKTDVLNNNGRFQKFCKICNLPTAIPKGESDYPDYHKQCYTKNKLQGNNNPNYQNKHKDSKCTNCNIDIKKYDSQVLGKHFCSISCSTQHYNIPENQSEAKKRALIIQKDTLRKLVKTPEFKIKSINSRKIEEIGTEDLEGVQGIIVPIGWGARGTDGKIAAIKYEDSPLTA